MNNPAHQFQALSPSFSPRAAFGHWRHICPQTQERGLCKPWRWAESHLFEQESLGFWHPRARSSENNSSQTCAGNNQEGC